MFLQIIFQKLKEFIEKFSSIKFISLTLIRNFGLIRQLLRLSLRSFHYIDYDQLQNFLHIRIGFRTQSQFYNFPLLNFISLDYFTKVGDKYFQNLRRLPCRNNKVEDIYIKHFFYYFPSKKHWKKALMNWYKKLIPGGKLKIYLYKNDKKSNELLNNFLKEINRYNFERINSCRNNITEIYSSKYYYLAFYKKNKDIKSKNTESHILDDKIKNITNILKNLKESYYRDKSVIIISKTKIRLKNIESEAKYVRYYNLSSNNILENRDSYDFGILFDELEYYHRNNFLQFFQQIKYLLKPKSKILILVPNQLNFFKKDYKLLFNKAILTELVDDIQLEIKWMTLDTTFNLIKLLLINEPPFPSKVKPIKIAVLGNIDTRYAQLNSFWDGIIRALIKLGYKPLLLDIRTIPPSEILRRMRKYAPHYLFTGLKRSLFFLKNNAEFFRKSDISVIFWFRDARLPEEFNFNGVIDYMFLTNQGQIQKYQKMFNIKNVFYMPQWCNPQFSHPNSLIKENYDIGFAGQLDFERFHKERTQILLKLRKKNRVKIETNEFNSISEIYSKCKVVFGYDIDSHKLFGVNFEASNSSNFNKFIDFYASNRLFISVGCGTCYFINYFPGIVRLFENKKHLVWYKSFKELNLLIKDYLYNDKNRLFIKKEAYKLAKRKHTHIHRLKNVLDIIMGKTRDFYGYLN